ncbi:4'-phosphopantetheinyl transferase superfamily protein [Arthrobacter sp. KBS0703]|nr:4'-phosphopantetheinyl transferase superfamily protein [Arthrobacter sp. KBS0703]
MMLQVRAFQLSNVDVGRSWILDPAELTRAALFSGELPRRRFLAGRLVQRHFAAELLGLADDRLEIDYHCPACGQGSWLNHGRPGYTVEGRPVPLVLSLSRCGDWAVVAGQLDADLTGAVGVDVEDESSTAFEGFDATLLTDGEQRLTLSTPEHSRPQLRAQLWTRKEALLKALGTGLAREPNGIDVVADPRVRSMAPEPLGLPSNLVVAVAWLALPPRR